ncbi:MAG TPA: hypothetical protein VMV56_10615 [Williamwhitmania sp.]|nr:hypothetical protein [Williamwhitmania sp.]
MKRFSILMIAALASLTFASCQKDTTPTNPLESTTVDDNQVTSYVDDATNEINDVTMKSDNSQSAALAAFATDSTAASRTVAITFSGDTIIKTVTYVNWTNPNSNNGHVKNGVIRIAILGGPLQSTFLRIATFQNFSIDGNAIEGTRTITKTSDNVYTYTLTGGKVTFTDGTTYTRTSTQTRTWVDGFDTPFNIWDDIWTIEGSETGVNRSGMTYTHTIVNPLMIKLSCRWIVSGTIDITVGTENATVDYGDGACDNQATLTYNGKTYDFNLR